MAVLFLGAEYAVRPRNNCCLVRQFYSFCFLSTYIYNTNMKAITIWQPYAQAIALGLKTYETRSWPTKYRGKIAVHASIKPLSQEGKRLSEKYGIKNFSFSKIIVIADLTDCILITEEFIKLQPQIEIDFGNWLTGYYAWKLENIQALKNPIKVSGKQGLWNVYLKG